MTTTFKFYVGQIVASKSGTPYRIQEQRDDNHRKLKGEIGYLVVGWRNGKLYGPCRLIRESALASPLCGEG